MTRTVRSEEQVQALKPEYVAPLVAVLCHENAPVTGKLYESGSGWFAQTRWERARGVDFDCEKGAVTPEEVLGVMGRICDFEIGETDYPEMPGDGGRWSIANALRRSNVDQKKSSRL